MTKRQLVKWLEAKQSDAKAEVEIQYATAEKAYFAQRDEALKINETVDEVFRLISEADTMANRWKEALEKVEGIDTTCGWYTSLTTKLSDLSDKENIRMYIMKDFTDGTDALRQLKAKRSETLREIEKNYINVIANVESMKNAKTALWVSVVNPASVWTWLRSTASKVTSWTKLTSQKSWAMWCGISQLPPTLSATTSRRCCR